MSELSSCLETQSLYPLCLSRGETDADDLNKYNNDLNSRASKLFVTSEAKTQVKLRQSFPSRLVSIGSASEGKWSAPISLSTKEGLQYALQKTAAAGTSRIFTIERANSWSRMNISLDMFRVLCEALKTTPKIIDLVRGMEFKSAPGDEHHMGCYYSLCGADKQSTSMTDLGFQICYNLRYFEKHGRDLGDPWSCRQTIFYQRYLFNNASSSWIIIQPSARWQSSLDDAVIDNSGNPLTLHLRSLSTAIANNWEYLEDLSSRLIALDKRVSFPKSLNKFDFDFTLNQQVHSVRKKLHHMKTILNGTERTVAALSSLAKTLLEQNYILKSGGESFCRELDHISRDIETYKSTTDELLELSSDIKTTINSILNLRNQDIMNFTSSQMHSMAASSSYEAQLMGDVAKATYADSRTMRIATIIALIYLPASLVLTFFSTVFVDIESSGPKFQLLIHGQVWIEIVAVVALIFLTVALFLVWNLRGKKRKA